MVERKVDGGRKRILCVVGTRPEGIKMAPVIRALREQPWAETRVLSTAQHRQLLDQVLALFDIQPDLDLDVMQDNQTLPALTARLIERLDQVLGEEVPDMVIAQGDTTTVFAAALCAFYRNIPFAHVEAGLRTGNRRFPFPEEMNRVFAGYMSALHFAPTESSRANLLAEGVDPSRVHVTGNTVIDALLYQAGHTGTLPAAGQRKSRKILMTAHRRENFGAPLAGAFSGLIELLDRFEDAEVLYPVHPNPNVRELAQTMLAHHPRIQLCEPLGYAEFVEAMLEADLIITDSGGVQEEAPALAKPVLVLRNETERPEAVEAGVVSLVGPNQTALVREASRLLSDDAYYCSMARGVSPYGDGRAAMRIVRVLADYFEVGKSGCVENRLGKV